MNMKPIIAHSYTRLNEFELCPKRFYETKLVKSVKEEESEAMVNGFETHQIIATALKKRQPLPLSHSVSQRWIDRLLEKDGSLLVEQEWAITQELQPCGWFADPAWCRVKADAVVINKDAGLVTDWKTGKSDNASETQLELSALVMYAHYPQLKRIITEYVFLKEDRKIQKVIDKNEIAGYWSDIMPRLKKVEAAMVAGEFPPKYGRFCAKWCPVRSCEYHGK